MSRNSDEEGRRISNLGSLLKRRGFFWPSYEIYGGAAGFFDLGPLGSLFRENIESAWKGRFVVQEGFLLVDCPTITPEIAFKWSGHLEKFTDHLSRCSECLTPFRSDHLLDDLVENADAMGSDELRDAIIEYGIKCPVCGGKLQEPEEFNLMFKTHIGPGSDRPAYLRPETAQSIFMNFSLLYRMNREKMPFGVAQLGKGFRNEISPRQGMVRQREFHMAEGEFFFDPEEERFPPFMETGEEDVRLVPRNTPSDTMSMTLKEAYDKEIICSEVLAHFMAVTQRFAADIGIDREKIRFRQHLDTEMAHYARDCWDLEVLTSYGWVEMVGIADRSAYDLSQHSKGSGQDLSAKRKFSEPRSVKTTRITADMKILGPIFRGGAKEVADAVSTMDPVKASNEINETGRLVIEISSGTVEVPENALDISDIEETVTGIDFTPHVVEPSFGIDRLMVAVLEHSYHEAEKSPMKDQAEQGEGPYKVLRLLPGIAPVKCGVFPLMNKDGLPELALEIDRSLRGAGLTTYYDHSGSIGRRYARMDEIGTPYSITVDYESLDDRKVTLRDRDSGKQSRLDIEGIDEIVTNLIVGKKDFDSL